MRKKYKLTEELTKKLQSLKAKTILEFHKNESDYYNQNSYMRQSNTYMFQEYSSTENAQSLAMIMHEA